MTRYCHWILRNFGYCCLRWSQFNSQIKWNEWCRSGKGQIIIPLFTSEWLSANFTPPPPFRSLVFALAVNLNKKRCKHDCRNTVSVPLLLLRRRVSPVTSITINIHSRFRLTICSGRSHSSSVIKWRRRQQQQRGISRGVGMFIMLLWPPTVQYAAKCTHFPRFRTKVSEMETKDGHARPSTAPAKWLCRNEQRTETIQFSLHLSTYTNARMAQGNSRKKEEQKSK